MGRLEGRERRAGGEFSGNTAKDTEKIRKWKGMLEGKLSVKTAKGNGAVRR